uniref:Uncharacterized protein n=1 Tax=Anguilla anguilla TaxID=7936 RepID=A0A0E9UUF1_ANGAN
MSGSRLDEAHLSELTQSFSQS